MTTALFSIVKCLTISASTLNNDFLKIQDWVYQWKIFFSLDQTSQAQEVIFSRNTNISRKPSLYFNNTRVEQAPVQKPLRKNGKLSRLPNTRITNKQSNGK